MTQPVLTPEQQAAVSACDDTLKAAGLTTYTHLEESLAMALTMCWESTEMGKQLLKKIDKMEKRKLESSRINPAVR